MLKKQFAFLLRRKNLLFFFLLFLSASHFSFAQEKITVSGTVSSDSSMPLSSMSISVKGQAGGTTSAADGAFIIKVNKGATLIFSIVGYEERQIKIEKETSGLSVNLTSKSTGLNDVVVIGYGTQKAKDVTSSISTVNINDTRGHLADLLPTNFSLYYGPPSRYLQSRFRWSVSQASASPGSILLTASFL